MASMQDEKRTPVPRPPTYPVPDDHIDEAGELGEIHIHNSVIAVIARVAAVKVKGVVDLVGTLVDGIAGIVGKNADRGVHVEIVDNNVVLELKLMVEYGVNIPRVAWQVQADVRQAVEQMTGKSVKAVNVIVQSLRVPPPAPAAGGEAGE
jgi:uncharacterized alkaline shock family protein YloU